MATPPLSVMDRPLRIPDLNITEAVLDHLEREHNKEELWDVL